MRGVGLFALWLQLAGAQLAVHQLTTEHLAQPLGLDRPRPRFSWQIAAGGLRGVRQTAYRLLIGPEGAADGSVWDSGLVASARSYHVRYAGPALLAGRSYSWSVELSLEAANGSRTNVHAAPAVFSMGMLSRAAWGGAALIGAGSGDQAACPWFRKTFRLPASARGTALVHLASVGYHELTVNGQPASEGVLLPSVSYLPKRVLYRTYNISALLKPGVNALGVWASAGWAQYPDLNHSLANLAPLVLVRLDVAGQVILSDKSWKVRMSSTRHLGPWGAGGFGGDQLDDSQALSGWDSPGLDDSSWGLVAVYPLSDYPGLEISADAMEATVRHSTVPAKSVSPAKAGDPHFPPPPPGSWLVEMDELFTGWFEVKNMQGAPNSTVQFQVSTTGGVPVEFAMQNEYKFGPSGRGDFRMRFSYNEIQYITIIGLKAKPAPTDVLGTRLTSLGQRTGQFECSNALMTRIYDVTVNNYQGLTTGGMTVDCPHRERRGYGGDGHTSYQFALANYQVGAYFSKWMRDFADTQGETGGSDTKMPKCTTPGKCWVPNTAPTVSGGGGPAWGGFVVTNPWQTYNTYGNEDILADMYPTMESLLAFFADATQDDGLLHCWDGCVSQWIFLGDWITPHGSESNITSPENILFNSCYLHYITKLVANISSILGFEDKAAFYRAAAAKLADAINTKFGSSDGVYLDSLQTHAVMPLASGVVPTALEDKTMGNLAQTITVTDKGHLDTGLTGTYFMVKMLMESGRNDLIFTFTNQTTFPSYGYFLSQGFTTWPEQWDTSGNGLSKMHGCFNGIGLWFIEGIAGIRVHASEDPPLTIRAGVDAGDVTRASGQRTALYGLAQSAWAVTAHGFSHNVTIPANGKAKVLIPSRHGPNEVTEDGKPLTEAPGVTVLGDETINQVNYVAVEVLSGEYHFQSPWSTAEQAARGKASARDLPGLDLVID